MGTRAWKRLHRGAGWLAVVLVVASFGAAAAPAATGDTTWTLAGTGTAADTGDGGQAREAAINQPRSVFATTTGYVWAEPWSHRVRVVDANGVIRTLAGTGTSGFSGDGGPAAAAQLNFVHSAAPTADGGYLLADELNNRIRKISPDGLITTVAGTGVGGYGGDGGSATSAQINNPRGVVALADGGFLIPDSNNHRIRKVSAAGVITTVAGTGVQGFTGDGGPATAAQLSIPFGVAPTSDGGFLIVDIGNARIRKVSPAGVISTVAGTGIDGFSGDGGPATSASINAAHNVVASQDGGFLIADAGNQRVRRVAGDGIISTVIGDGVRGYSGDGGPAAAAQVSVPKAVALTPSGDVLIADEQNNRIRFVGTVVAPTSSASPAVTGNPVQGQQLTATGGGWTGTGPVISYQWQRCSPSCTNISAATNSTYTAAAADAGSTLRVTVTASNSSGSSQASSAQTAVVTGNPTPPVNTVAPSVSGVARVGETLTAEEGSWSGTTPMTFSYRWRRCDAAGAGCGDIPGATAKTYLVASADGGSTLRVVVTAANGSSVYASAVSGEAPRSYWRFGGSSGALVDERGVADGAFIGGPQRGVAGLLTGDPDTAVSFNGSSQYADVPAAAAWTPAAFSIELIVRPSELPDNRTIWSTQGSFTGWWLNTGPSGNVRMFVGDGSGWRFDGSGPVLNPGSSYHLVATYDGSNVRLYVNGTLVSTGPNATMASNGGANVMRFGAFSTGPGQYWPGALDDASFYPAVLTPSQVQAHYNAAVTGSQATSAPSAAVTTTSATPPSNTSAPVVSGTAQQGQTLTASTGSWSGTAPISYSYQWQRCSPSCTNISAATASTYTVAAADVGSSLRVTVTAGNSSGSSQASSTQTAVVTAPAGTETTVTFNISAGADDGDVKANNMGTGAPYPPATTPSANSSSTTFAVRRSGPVFSGYEVRVGLLRFDTSALPDGATVTGATLRLYVDGRESGNARSLVGEWYSAANWPIDTSDYTLNPATTAHAGTPITSLTENAQNNLALQNLASISTTGSTGLRLHVNGGAPSGENNVFFNSSENNSNKPQLTVTYTTP